MKTGDQVVCIKTHSQGVVTKGLIYTILGAKKNRCCGYVAFDVGVRGTSERYQCGRCDKIDIDSAGTWWIGSNSFAPIQRDEFLSSDQIEKSAEEKIDIKLPVEV